MGNLLGYLFEEKSLSLKRHQRILMLGLDNAGKTTILQFLQHGQSDKDDQKDTLPTVGFNVESVTYNRLQWTVWDVGGQHMIRPLWRHYYANTDALVYVIDSSDEDRFEEAKEELDTLLRASELHSAVLLVFSNKSDLCSVSSGEVAERLGLSSQKHRQWFVQCSSANQGSGLYPGFDWLCDALSARDA